MGFLGHGVRAESDTIMLFYLLRPEFRGRGIFGPMIKAFAEWCRAQYPDKAYLRANTEKTNRSSVAALERAGFSVEALRRSPAVLRHLPEKAHRLFVAIESKGGALVQISVVSLA